MLIPIIVRVRTIWKKLFFNIGVSFDVLVSRKYIFLESSHLIGTHLDVVLEIIEVQSSVSFNFGLDEEFIEFW